MSSGKAQVMPIPIQISLYLHCPVVTSSRRLIKRLGKSSTQKCLKVQARRETFAFTPNIKLHHVGPHPLMKSPKMYMPFKLGYSQPRYTKPPVTDFPTL